jgi:predicted butyrate kinase (DUF1464 family)
MPRVVGMDPGTLSLDLLGLEDGRPFLSRSFTGAELATDSSGIVRYLDASGPFDLIAGPSGYGLPLVPIAEVGEREIQLLLLAKPGSASPLGGLGSLLRALRAARLPVVLTPGVIHLPSVPPHRKANRVDLGTADKVAVAAYAIDQQARMLGVPLAETSFVLVELGGAFTAVLSVVGGRIVSGEGGSSGPMGFRAAGALDGEAALVLDLDKKALFSGGAAFIAGDPEMAPEELATRTDRRARDGLTALVESVAQSVAGQIGILGPFREIVLSGRLSRVPGIRDPIVASLERFRSVRVLTPPPLVKEAAFGAALIADGLAGGSYRPLVVHMQIPEAAGSALDHLHMRGSGSVETWLSGS